MLLYTCSCNMLTLALVIACGVLICSTLGAEEPRFSVPGMGEQFGQALECVSRWRAEDKLGAPTHHRLAAIYLHSHAEPSVRDAFLPCSIKQLLENLAQFTPADVFVFTMDNMHDHINDRLHTDLPENMYKRICMLSIPKEQWYHNPRKTGYKLESNVNRYGDYLYMGQWRILVPFTLMNALGYPFFLQVDDDLMIVKPLKVNIVEEMQVNNRLIATHSKQLEEEWSILHGLPELARFFLTSNNLTAKGSLYKHLNPPNMDGLYSAPKPRWWQKLGLFKSGYDRIYLYGNFLIMSSTIWSNDIVQDFITLCLNSGGLERHRWQEQGVFTFIYLMFTDPEELWHIPRSMISWVHTKNPEKLRPICGDFRLQIQ